MKKYVVCYSTLLFLIGFTAPADAMHITEEILPFQWALLWYIVSLPFVVMSIKILKKNQTTVPFFKPFLGMIGAVIFLISCMPVPVPTAGTCSHPCGTGLAAILVGPYLSILLTSIALLIQALFLAHGGLSTWGANIVSMGVVGSFTGYFMFKILRRVKAPMPLALFMAGLSSDWATYLSASFELASALHGVGSFWKMFVTIVIAFVPTQLPLGIFEGLMTVGVIAFLLKRKPEILKYLSPITSIDFKKTCSIAIFFTLLSFYQTPVLANKWQGVDETVVEKYAIEANRPPKSPVINIGQGDLLLFMFLLAGAGGGFILGYNYHIIFSDKNKDKSADTGV